MAIENIIYSYISQEEEYNKGDAIIKEGSRGYWVYIILEGTVKVKKDTPKGVVSIDSLSEGEIFGEMVLLQAGKSVRTASIIADSKVKVGLLDTERLIKEYESVSPHIKSLIASLMHRLEKATHRAVRLAAHLE